LSFSELNSLSGKLTSEKNSEKEKWKGKLSKYNKEGVRKGSRGKRSVFEDSMVNKGGTGEEASWRRHDWAEFPTAFSMVREIWK